MLRGENNGMATRLLSWIRWRLLSSDPVSRKYLIANQANTQSCGNDGVYAVRLRGPLRICWLAAGRVTPFEVFNAHIFLRKYTKHLKNGAFVVTSLYIYKSVAVRHPELPSIPKHILISLQDGPAKKSRKRSGTRQTSTTRRLARIENQFFLQFIFILSFFLVSHVIEAKTFTMSHFALNSSRQMQATPYGGWVEVTCWNTHWVVYRASPGEPAWSAGSSKVIRTEVRLTNIQKPFPSVLAAQPRLRQTFGSGELELDFDASFEVHQNTRGRLSIKKTGSELLLKSPRKNPLEYLSVWHVLENLKFNIRMITDGLKD